MKRRAPDFSGPTKADREMEKLRRMIAFECKEALELCRQRGVPVPKGS